MAKVTQKTVERANAEVTYLEKKAEVTALKAAWMVETDPVTRAKLKAALKTAQLQKQEAGRTFRGAKRKAKSADPVNAILRAAGVKG